MQGPVLKPKFKLIKSDNPVKIIDNKYSIKKHESKLNSVIINGRTYPTNFSSKQLSKIYNSPVPNPNKKIVIGVISLGGGLVGKLTTNVLHANESVDSNSGTLTNGDVQNYWNWQGIVSSNWPTVIIKSVDGTKNTPSSNPYSANYSATIENTLDVETVGSWCSSSNVTIILYLAKNNNFYAAMNYAINSNVKVGTNTYKPSVISVSWGAQEPMFSQNYANQFNILLSNAAYKGINICVASGDSYSTDGLTSNSVDFPSCSPWVTACGGTSLICPGNTYTSLTLETVWNNPNNAGGTGGGTSIYFSKPSYQSNVMSNITKRCVPDISLNSDPYTGIVYYINGKFMENIGGTSTAAPAMAGVIASLNISSFINPILYSLNSNCFHDITKGNNIGYSATKGYDLCTGLGSLNGTIFTSSINTLNIVNHSEVSTVSEDIYTPYMILKNPSPNVPLNNYFTCVELARIYECPPPPNTSNTIGVISLGGGLYGTLNPNTGILTNGDLQAYWTAQGIPSSNHPRVIVKIVDTATNSPLPNDPATGENTLDIQTIGSWYPSSKLTIIMYLAQNSNFYGAMDYAINSNVVIGGNTYSKPSVISISWGAPEIYVSSNYANIFNTLLAKAANNGINITVATGDYGSTSGILGGSNIADFPSSSPNVIACGGTRLVCPNNVYDSSTVETVWNNAPRTNGATGGGISRLFRKGAYQSKITQSANFRCAPDISLNADPETGIQYIVNGKTVIYGGTSTVSPAMAAVISILNINYFLNTKLYTLKRNCFHDIINGNNGGYTAGTGYDLCSGLGSLSGSNFVAAINPVPTTGITITSPMGTRVIKLKGKLQLTATVNPTNANNKNVNWSSSNKNIIRVSSTGLCTANRFGSANITASQGNIKTNISLSVTLKLSIKNITIEQNIPCMLKLSDDLSEYTIKNQDESMIDCQYVDNAWKLTGKMPGEVSLEIEYINSNTHGILNVKIV